MTQDILVLTLGAGRESDLEGTLFTPLRKSVSDGRWSEVILLPSQQTARYAGPLAAALPHLQIRTCPLPEPGAEDDVDACYEFFSSVLSQTVAAAGCPDNVCVDFTRGTKAMSAAVVLAATTLGIRRLRYITGERFDGTVQPGREVVRTGIADRISIRMRLADGWEAVKIGQFSAALALFPDGAAVPDEYAVLVSDLRMTAGLYGAWDRFDYAFAAKASENMASVSATPPADHTLSCWQPGQAARRHLSRVARQERMSPDFLRHLTADILANAHRRLAWGQPEDALVRIYRASELIGQIRLALRGLDSENVDQTDPAVKTWLEDCAKKGKSPSLANGKLSLARFNAARFLKHVKDPLGRPLLQLDNVEGLQPKQRNNSLLAHGFTAVTPGNDAAAHEALRLVESIFRSEDPGNDRILESAQFPWFS